MDKEFTGSKAFLNIPVGIARDEDLLKKPKTIFIMDNGLETQQKGEA